jgi:hypothetical protein
VGAHRECSCKPRLGLKIILITELPLLSAFTLFPQTCWQLAHTMRPCRQERNKSGALIYVLVLQLIALLLL